MKYKINKNLILQEDIGPIVRGGLQKYLGVNYSEKDGYKNEKDGSISYTHPDSIKNMTPKYEMKSMDEFEDDVKNAGRLGNTILNANEQQ